jgi:hypothetical protein
MSWMACMATSLTPSLFIFKLEHHHSTSSPLEHFHPSLVDQYCSSTVLPFSDWFWGRRKSEEMTRACLGLVLQGTLLQPYFSSSQYKHEN